MEKILQNWNVMNQLRLNLSVITLMTSSKMMRKEKKMKRMKKEKIRVTNERKMNLIQTTIDGRKTTNRVTAKQMKISQKTMSIIVESMTYLTQTILGTNLISSHHLDQVSMKGLMIVILIILRKKKSQEMTQTKVVMIEMKIDLNKTRVHQNSQKEEMKNLKKSLKKNLKRKLKRKSLLLERYLKSTKIP